MQDSLNTLCKIKSNNIASSFFGQVAQSLVNKNCNNIWPVSKKNFYSYRVKNSF